MDLVKNLLKIHCSYTFPPDVRCSTDVWSLLAAWTSGSLQSSGLWMFSSYRTSVSCVLGRGSLIHSGRSSDDCRTSGRICASGGPTLSGHLTYHVHLCIPNGLLSTPTIYIYTFPFHGIGLTVHFELAKNTPHSLSLSFTYTKS